MRPVFALVVVVGLAGCPAKQASTVDAGVEPARDTSCDAFFATFDAGQAAVDALVGHCVDDTCTDLVGPDDAGVGYARCDHGSARKTGPAHCEAPAAAPPDCATIFVADAGACVTNADCGSGQGCVAPVVAGEGEGEPEPCTCRGCVVDDDCGAGNACDCGLNASAAGACVPASCFAGADCASGVCGAFHFGAGCGYFNASIACFPSTDHCGGDCSTNFCVSVDDTCVAEYATLFCD